MSKYANAPLVVLGGGSSGRRAQPPRLCFNNIIYLQWNWIERKINLIITQMSYSRFEGDINNRKPGVALMAGLRVEWLSGSQIEAP